MTEMSLTQSNMSSTARPKVVILVEYPSSSDVISGQLLSGTTGKLFWEGAETAGFSALRGAEIIPVLRRRPFSGKLEDYCLSKKDAEAMVGKGKYPYAFIKSGKWLDPKFFPELDEAKRRVEELQPNLIIALGALPTWLCLNDARVTRYRGTCAESWCGIKCLPTYSPAVLIRDYSNLAVLSADLLKAKREMEFPEIQRRERKIYVPENIVDLAEIEKKCLASPRLSIDIETAPNFRQITCIGFGFSETESYVIPFCHTEKDGGNYWESATLEIATWRVVKNICESSVPKVLQNGMYDLQWLWRIAHCKVLNFDEDTMLMHHCLYPELPKALGFLGSIYTNEPSWKLMRRFEEKELK